MTERKRILFILHLPPPVHGAAMVGAAIRDSRLIGDSFDCRFVNLSASSSIDEVGKVRFRKLGFLFRLFRRVRKEIREWNPDLVYMTPTSTLPGFIKDYLVARFLQRKGCRIISHFHNKGISEHQDRWLDNFLYTRFFRDMRVILLSERLYPDIHKYVPWERVEICPNGVAFPSLTPSRYTGIPEIVFISNLLAGKGFHDLLSACRELHAGRGMAFLCRFVGAPSKDTSVAAFNQEVKALGIEEVVQYDGPLYGVDKQAVLARASIFVHPTREDCFPLVILEAMAAGLPVVSTREGGVPDEVEDGVTGILCEKGDPKALADAIETLLVNPSLRERMGREGRSRYEAGFTIAAFEKRLTGILQRHV